MWAGRRRRLTWAAAVVVAIVTVVAVVRWRMRADPKPTDTFRSGLFEPPRVAPPIDLEGPQGTRVHLADYRGKVVVLEFGFTSCHQICPVTLHHLAEAFKAMGEAAKDVQVVFVTVDPKRDNPERLAQFLSNFDPSFIGATGTPEELQAVRDSYGIVAEEVISKNALLGYEVNHSSFVYLIDREGWLRGLIPFGKPARDIANDIVFLLTK